MPDKIALQDLSAEEEADRLLAEEEARTGPTSNFTPKSDDTEFREGLRELEEEDGLPSPASQGGHSTTAVSSRHFLHLLIQQLLPLGSFGPRESHIPLTGLTHTLQAWSRERGGWIIGTFANSTLAPFWYRLSECTLHRSLQSGSSYHHQ